MTTFKTIILLNFSQNDEKFDKISSNTADFLMHNQGL